MAAGEEEHVEEPDAPSSPFQEVVGPLLAGLHCKRDEFEDRGESAVRARLRAQVGERTSKREVDRFLALMRERGSGSIAVAWRRYFDSDGDGELSFTEFCQALVELRHEGDVIRLWHDLSSAERPDSLGLEDLDTEAASALDFFGSWCRDKFGGPNEFFQVIDADGSDSLTKDEFAEGLTELGFFTAEGLPECLENEYKVLTNLYPLLDQTGSGACSCEQLMFLEKDKDKRAKLLRELARIREYGREGAPEPLKSNAQRMLHKIAMKTTTLGGMHWKAVTEEVAVGDTSNPSSPKSVSLSLSGSGSFKGKMGRQDSRGRLLRANTAPAKAH